ncbi:MAG: helix-turn-helix transcriptional regulator [Pseudomonadota bacterium]
MASTPARLDSRAGEISAIDDRLIGLREVVLRTGRSRPTIYRALAAGTFPRGQLRSGRRLWWLSEVMRFLREEEVPPPS